MDIMDLGGKYEVRLSDGSVHAAVLPGTLDENCIGYDDKAGNQWHPAEGLGEADDRNSLLKSDVITTRLTRKYTYEGNALFKREFSYDGSGRVFLEFERTRAVNAVKVNGKEVKAYLKGTLSTPYVYEITGFVDKNNTLEINVDNSYPDMPKEAIKYSSAATDETQTNWNGILGFLRLRVEKNCFISGIRVYPRNGALDVVVETDTKEAFEGVLYLKSRALRDRLEKSVALKPGKTEVLFEACEIAQDALLWDEYEGNLYEMTAGGNSSHGTVDEKTVSFGIRYFDGEGGHLRNNGHRIFLRGEANCCVFPETGHMPLSVSEWDKIMQVYKSYGLNCVRFHSHCAPEAAFVAADKLGMFVQPELSHWDPKTAFETPESAEYYELEMRQILYCYANHPSFVMLTLGNELNAKDEDCEKMTKLLRIARSLDSTRLYANGSNTFYGLKGADPESDFYTSCGYYDSDLRATNAGMLGYLNNKYPDSKTNYDKTMEIIREAYDKPVFSFEVGQYEVLPDFAELEEFKGVTVPDNLKAIKDAVEEAGYIADWKKRVEVTGELSLLAYREEVEAAMRTRDMSGISLLGLQDFTGQGTALVGMLNPHLESKPYAFAKPERFCAFTKNVLPMAYLSKYVYEEAEEINVKAVLANYGTKPVNGKEAKCAIYKADRCGKNTALVCTESFGEVVCPCGEITELGTKLFRLSNDGKSGRYNLRISVGENVNEYPVWVYPKKGIEKPDSIMVAETADDALALLMKGCTVFLEPKAEKESFVDSIATCFTTDFWSVGTFPSQEGYMGCMPDPKHPAFADFPTNFYPEWQWWIITKARAMVIPKEVTPMLTVLDCYARLRKMAFLFEGRVGDGKLLVSSLGLRGKEKYPEARALLNSLYAYMDSKAFNPENVISEETLKNIVK